MPPPKCTASHSSQNLVNIGAQRRETLALMQPRTNDEVSHDPHECIFVRTLFSSQKKTGQVDKVQNVLTPRFFLT